MVLWWCGIRSHSPQSYITCRRFWHLFFVLYYCWGSGDCWNFSMGDWWKCNWNCLFFLAGFFMLGFAGFLLAFTRFAWLCVVDSWQHTNVFRIYDSAILGSFSDKLWHLDLRYRFKLTPSNLQLCEMQGSLLLVSCIFKCFLPAKVLYALLMCFNFCFNLFFYSTLRFKHSSGNLTVVKFNIFH